MLFNLNIDYLIALVKFVIPFLLGSLLFFTIIIAPTVFSTLDAKNSRKIIRNIFPKLYTWSIIFSFISFILVFSIFNINLWSSFSFLILILYIISRQILMPKINSLSDRNEQKRFANYHSLSVTIFVIQVILLLTVYVNV
ncbi:DUF4149 domain-containing protein [Alphaproteobacteria bacterium]|nr:DUF4149 domain-containing protein [Alphaproteobacteria bacterium]